MNIVQRNDPNDITRLQLPLNHLADVISPRTRLSVVLVAHKQQLIRKIAARRAAAPREGHVTPERLPHPRHEHASMRVPEQEEGSLACRASVWGEASCHRVLHCLIPSPIAGGKRKTVAPALAPSPDRRTPPEILFALRRDETRPSRLCTDVGWAA
eukprot:3640751-Prymnesium_polylepis.1